MFLKQAKHEPFFLKQSTTLLKLDPNRFYHRIHLVLDLQPVFISAFLRHHAQSQSFTSELFLPLFLSLSLSCSDVPR